MSRKTDRNHAFNLIFQMDFFDDLQPLILIERYFGAETFLGEDEGKSLSLTAEADMEYVRKTLSGIAEHRDAIDAEIKTRARGWELDRLMKTDLAILRLAVYEIMYEPGIPNKVAINEAVELTKVYSGGDSPAFVNGLLGQIVRSGGL
ncbi:MAG: transcription antitermination factor NusB [Clostridiales bacterium]|jgi:N utilization substance protein B|nr:transcription antitermination factor NusB [Clostridiales bacterium]